MKRPIVLISLIFVLFYACKKDETNNLPGPNEINYEIETGTVQDISNYKAKITASIAELQDMNVSEHGHVWSTEPNPTLDLESKTQLGALENEEFTSQIVGLDRETTYYVRAYIIDGNGEHYGEEVSFETTNKFFEVNVNHLLFIDEFYNERAWFLLYSLEGELIEMQEIFNNNQYQFDWPENTGTGEFNLQVFTYAEGLYNGSSNYYYMDSYLNVKPGQWTLGYDTDPSGKVKIGEHTIQSGDANFFNGFTVCNSEYSGYSLMNNTLSIKQYVNPDKLFFMKGGTDGIPNYTFIDNLGLSETINLSATDLEPMSNFVEMALPVNETSMVQVYPGTNSNHKDLGLLKVFSGGLTGLGNLKIHYPGSLFDTYYTFAQINNANITEKYHRFNGEIPDMFVQAPLSINVSNNSITGFNAAIDGEPDYALASWKYTDLSSSPKSYFYYYVYGSKNAISQFSAPELPDELVQLSTTTFSLTNLEYRWITFYDWDVYKDYDEYLKYNYGREYSHLSSVTNELYVKQVLANSTKRGIEDIREIDNITLLKRHRLDLPDKYYNMKH